MTTAARSTRARALQAAVAAATLAMFAFTGSPSAVAAAAPPLAKSGNVTVLGNLATGPALGMNFKGHYAFVTGSQGLTVLDIATPAAPVRVTFFALPHFENEDVDLCGDVLLISNDRESKDLGAILYVFDISQPASPSLSGVLPLGLTGTGRGSGHIANFVKADCTMAWIDGGDHVEVVDLRDPSNPRSLGKFESVASRSDAFRVSHDTERDSKGLLWNVGGGGAAGYKLTANPLAPQLVASTSAAGTNPSPYNDFILHNSQRRGNVLLVTEEDYVDTSETPPGGCRGQGKFETWSLARMAPGAITPIDTWQTELNGLLFGGSPDSKAPVTVNCSSHWFDTVGGIAAVGWYEQGTRFLDVSKPGNIRQVGYYLPANGSTWAAYWSPTDPSHSIVYTADAYLGVEVLKINRKASNSDMPTLTAPIPQSWYGDTGLTYNPSVVWQFSCPRLTTGV
jgi:hypothetical protein